LALETIVLIPDADEYADCNFAQKSYVHKDIWPTQFGVVPFPFYADRMF